MYYNNKNFKKSLVRKLNNIINRKREDESMTIDHFDYKINIIQLFKIYKNLFIFRKKLIIIIFIKIYINCEIRFN